jgi:hypothetical protein
VRWRLTTPLFLRGSNAISQDSPHGFAFLHAVDIISSAGALFPQAAKALAAVDPSTDFALPSFMLDSPVMD